MANDTFDGLIAGFESEYPDSDLYAYFGPISRPFDSQLIDSLASRRKRRNLVLMLTTLGGDPDAAYRIGRCIQRNYGLLPAPKDARSDQPSSPRVSIFVDSFCASAGTLITLGAAQVIMSEHAELSPLDIQIRKPDDMWERDSGLTPTQALDILERRSKSLFKEHFNQLRLDSGLGLTTRTALEVASTVTTGLLAPIYEQLDPMRLGEIERLTMIVAAYGERLGKYNLRDGALAKLLSGYPSHGFVIDWHEAAEELFNNVAVPKASLKALGERIRGAAQRRMTQGSPLNFFLTDEPNGATDADTQAGANNGDHKKTGAGNGAPAPRAPARPRPPRKAGTEVQGESGLGEQTNGRGNSQQGRPRRII